MMRYGLVMHGAGAIGGSFPTTSSTGLTYDPMTGVWRDPHPTTIISHSTTSARSPSHPDHTAENWAKVGVAVATLGTQTALAIFQGLSVNDRAKAYAENTAALERLSASAGFANNPALQNEYSARLRLQQLIQGQGSSKTLWWVGGAAMVFILAYAMFRFDPREV